MTKDKNCGDDFVSQLKLPPDACDGIIGPSITDFAADIKPKALEAIQKCKDQND